MNILERLKAYHDALLQIARIDYRGNRHESGYIADKALKKAMMSPCVSEAEEFNPGDGIPHKYIGVSDRAFPQPTVQDGYKIIVIKEEQPDENRD